MAPSCRQRLRDRRKATPVAPGHARRPTSWLTASITRVIAPSKSPVAANSLDAATRMLTVLRVLPKSLPAVASTHRAGAHLRRRSGSARRARHHRLDRAPPTSRSPRTRSRNPVHSPSSRRGFAIRPLQRWLVRLGLQEERWLGPRVRHMRRAFAPSVSRLTARGPENSSARRSSTCSGAPRAYSANSSGPADEERQERERLGGGRRRQIRRNPRRFPAARHIRQVTRRAVWSRQRATDRRARSTRWSLQGTRSGMSRQSIEIAVADVS